MAIRKHNGFTLLELLIVLAILGIGAGVMAVSMGSKPLRMHTDIAAKESSALVRSARLEAINSGRNVILSASGSRIDAYLDTDSNRQVTSGDTLLTGMEIPTQVILTPYFRPVMFNNRGYLEDSTGAPTQLRMLFCIPEGSACKNDEAYARIDVNLAGIPEVRQGVYPPLD